MFLHGCCWLSPGRFWWVIFSPTLNCHCALSSSVELLQIPVKVKVTLWCPTLRDPMNYTVHGIFQARILEWVDFPFSRGSSQPRDWTQVSPAGRFFTSWATKEANTSTWIQTPKSWLNWSWELSLVSPKKRPWCWERLRAGGEGDDRGWDGWMASLTQWTWVWADSGSWWWTGSPGRLWFMGSQKVGHNWAAELNWGP